MKLILLVLLVAANGEGTTLALQHATEEDCQKAKGMWVQRIAHHNATEQLKIQRYAMECVELKNAPQGYSS